MTSNVCSLNFTVCYESCLKCSNTTKGTAIEHLCEECNIGYYSVVSNPTNCNFGCDELISYHYYDKNNNIQCISQLSCPIDYKFLIENTLQCSSDCRKHQLFEGSLLNNCISACPHGLYYDKKEIICNRNHLSCEPLC